MKATLTLKTAASEDPVTVAEAKGYLRVDEAADDALIASLIKAATRRLEAWADTCFIQQSWYVTFDGYPMSENPQYANAEGVIDTAVSEVYWPCSEFHLPIGPIRSLASMKVFAEDDAETTVDPSTYQVDLRSRQGRVALRRGQVWPSVVLRPINGVEFDVVVGLASSAAGVPEEIKQAVLILVGSLYESRGDMSSKEIPATAQMLVEPYRRLKLG